MDVRTLLSQKRPVFSFEFFLPQIPENLSEFLKNLESFKTLNPDFVTLTYGAGGSGRERTIEAAGLIKKETGLETACHLTGIAHTKREILERLNRLEELNIHHIVALRGDIPKGEKTPSESLDKDFPHAQDLISFIRQRGGFQIAAAGYPETHPDAVSPQDDIVRLSEKVKAGSDWVITQIFFDNKDYFDFVQKARANGVSCPIVPGLMPVTSFSQLKRFASFCKAKIPKKMAADLDQIQNDPEAVIRYGIDWSVKQAQELLATGAPGIHFFTLNRSHSTAQVLKNLRSSAH